MPLPILDGNQSATTLSTIFTSGAHIPAHTVVSLGAQAVSDISSAVSGISVSISGTQTTTFGAVSVSNFPPTQTIAGTVTANNEHLSSNQDSGGFPVLRSGVYAYDYGNDIQVGVAVLNPETSFPALNIGGTVTIGSTVTVGSISAAVLPRWEDDNQGGNQRTAKQSTPFPVRIYGDASSTSVTFGATITNSVTIGSLPAISGTVTVSGISTSVTARLVDLTGTAVSYAATGTAGTPSTDVISVQGVSGGTSLPISGTAGTLTTRFGSVITANTAQISSAVTNTSRKYLLIQNVTTSSNVITIGIGFTPATTQGIQLTAGAGITFESSYIPTGAVYVLSSVTASPFTILEA